MEEMNGQKISVICYALDTTLELCEVKLKQLRKKFRLTVSQKDRDDITNEIRCVVQRYNDILAVLKELSE